MCQNFFSSRIIWPGLKCLPRQKRLILRLQRPEELSANMNCGNEMKKWSSQWTQFMQLRKERSHSFLHFHFISAVHIWFISYIINTHFFHGNIWTHNWPAPNVSGFIAQLEEHRTGIARSRVQTPLKSGIFFRLLYAIFLHFHFISAVHIWFISYIISFMATYKPTIDLLPTSVAS